MPVVDFTFDRTALLADVELCTSMATGLAITSANAIRIGLSFRTDLPIEEALPVFSTAIRFESP
jgi:hypothetical protein